MRPPTPTLHKHKDKHAYTSLYFYHEEALLITLSPYTPMSLYVLTHLIQMYVIDFLTPTGSQCFLFISEQYENQFANTWKTLLENITHNMNSPLIPSLIGAWWCYCRQKLFLKSFFCLSQVHVKVYMRFKLSKQLFKCKTKLSLVLHSPHSDNVTCKNVGT